MSTLEDDDIFEIASTFPNPVVQQYAGSLQEAGATRASFDRPTITEELIRAGIPAIPAGDIVDAFRKHFVRGPVGVYWDIENVGLPQDVTALAAVTALRERIMSNFGDILEFKAYIDLELYTSKYDSFTRVALGDSGLQIVDATHGGVEMKRKEVADKLIIVDALWFALTHENPTVCIISGDSDFSPLLAKLRMRGIRTIVVTASQNVRSLREQATFALRWPEDFLLGCAALPAAQQRNRGVPSGRTTSPGRPRSPAAPPSPRQTLTPQTPSVQLNQATQGDPTVLFDDLLSCVKRAQRESGARKVRRATVAFYYALLNPLYPLSTILPRAVDKGVVKAGGVLNNAWIALGTDDVHEDLESMSSVDGSLSTLAPPQVANASEENAQRRAEPPGAVPLMQFEQWFITLRYGTHFGAYQEVHNFADGAITVQREVEPSGNFERMAVGPFANAIVADKYYQRHVGHMNLRPKITTRPQLRAAN